MSPANELKARAQDALDADVKSIIGLSEFIHGNPEVGFQETQASSALVAQLRQFDFNVDEGVGGLSTAFRATTGNGSLHIVICAEYDALPGIGHACGHNLIAAAALGAARSLQPICADLDLKVSVIGTPAEEGGGGKILLLQEGVFDGANAAVMVHPAAVERDAMRTLAVAVLRCDYYGVAAHAAARPEAGISASAALALAQTGIAYLREHFHATDRVHGIVVDGGDAPNIVPEHSAGRFFVRAASAERLAVLEDKVRNVFRGAATMTGTRVKITKTGPSFTDLRTHEAMADLWRANANNIGRNSLHVQDTDPVASTDMGNVSYAMPTIHPLIHLDAGGANIHEPAFAQAARGAAANKVITDGVTLLANTIIDVALDGDLARDLKSRSYRVANEPERAYLDEDWTKPEEFGSL